MGGSPIQSFTDGTAESTVAEALYEDVARAALTNTRWRFASDQAILNRLSDKPTGRWDAAYQMPHNLLMLSALTVNENRIKYDTYGDKCYTNAQSNDDVVADFIFRADEVNWPSYFTIAVEFSMASVLAVSVARDLQMSELMEQKGGRQMMLARRLESQSQTTRKLTTSRFLAERRS